MADASDRAPTLYEWAGGGSAVRRLLDAFYDRVEQDEVLSPFCPGGVHEEHRDRRFVELIAVAADDAGLPEDPEFRSALLAYAEWGSRLAFANSDSGAEVAEHAPVPHWGWGEAPPYQP